MKPGPKQKDFAVRRLGKPSQRAPGVKSGNLDRVIPSCPAFLTVPAKTEWKRVCAELSKVPGLLAAVDRSCLTEYCLSWAAVRDAELHLQKEGATMTIHGAHNYEVQQQSPWVGIQQGALKSMRSAADRLGFSPSARSSIHLVTSKSNGADPLAPPTSSRPKPARVDPEPIVAGAGELVQDKQQPTLSVEVPIAGAVVEEQPVTPSVDHSPVEEPADLPVEQPPTAADLEKQRQQQKLQTWCRGISSS
jgi:P27 family predicted phage terminase small subunit